MKKQEKISKYLFIILFVSCISLFALRLLSGKQMEISEINNRYAYQLPNFSFADFKNNVFQENFENAIGDQFIGSNAFTYMALEFNQTLYQSINYMLGGYSYKPVADDLYIYNGGRHLVFAPRNEDYIDNISNMEGVYFKVNADTYNAIELKDKYMYLINSDRSLNFDDINYEYTHKVAALYPEYEYAYLKIDSYEQYESYFYRNDHHWNFRGSYQGYTDIIKLILGEDEKALEPTDEIFIDIKYAGSKSASSMLYQYEDFFRAYRFDIPQYDLYVNGKLDDNDIRGQLINHSDTFDEYFRMGYSDYYGYNQPELIYDFHQPKKDNLLIIGISDKAAILELVASHFNKTYALFPSLIEEKLDLNKYIKKNKIDKVLLVSTVDGYGWPTFGLNLEVEK